MSRIGDPVSTLSVPGAKVEPVSPRSFASAPTVSVSTACSEPTVSTVGRPVLVASAEPMAASDMSISDGKISLDFVSTELQEVLKALSLQSGVNVVAGQDVKGSVTISLKNIAIEDALRLITTMCGYKYAQVNGAYVVGSEAHLNTLLGVPPPGKDVQATEVIIVKYADSSLITKIVESQFKDVSVTSRALKAVSASKEGAGDGSAGGDAKGSGGTGGGGDAKSGSGTSSGVTVETVIVLSGPQNQVSAAKSFVDQVESALAKRSQNMVVEVCEVKYIDLQPLPQMIMQAIPGVRVDLAPGCGFDMKSPSAIVTDSNTSYTNSAGSGAKAQSEPYCKAVILQGTRSEVDRAKEFIRQCDVQQAQITIEAKVIDITDTGKNTFGIDWGNSSGWDFGVNENRTSGDQALTVGRFSRTPFSLSATLNAIVNDNKGRLLANPNVMALDGKPASIFIGDVYKYVSLIQPAASGVSQVTTDTAKVGIQLNFVSSINSDGYITMNLHPEVSVVSSWVTVGGLSLPQIATRFVDSTIRVKDGETIIIGGLIKDDDIVQMSGVPVLKDLPFLGKLFQTRTKSREHSEIMMFITPRILTSN